MANSEVDARYYKKWSELNINQKKRSGSKEAHSQAREDAGLKGVSGGYNKYAAAKEKSQAQLAKSNEKNTAAVIAADKKAYEADPASAQAQAESQGLGTNFEFPEKKGPAKSGKTANYDVDKLSDFDLAGGGMGADRGRQRLSYKDLKGLEKQGFSKQELVDYAGDVSRSFDDNDKGFGQKAQNLLDSYKEALKPVVGGEDKPDNPEPEEPPIVEPPIVEPPPVEPPPVEPPIVEPPIVEPPKPPISDPPDEPEPEPEPGPGPGPGPGPDDPWEPGFINTGIYTGGNVNDSILVNGPNNGQIANLGGVAMGDNSEINQQIGNNKGDQTNNFSIGDGSWFIGNNNQGADYSVVIGNNSVGGYGGYGGGGSGTTNLNNMQSSVGYGALNDNAYHRSQAYLSGLGRSSQSVAQADAQTGAGDRINQLDKFARESADAWRFKGLAQMQKTYGEQFNYIPSIWESPDPLRRIEPTYKDDD